MVLSLCANTSVSFYSNFNKFDWFEGEFNVIILLEPMSLFLYAIKQLFAAKMMFCKWNVIFSYLSFDWNVDFGNS